MLLQKLLSKRSASITLVVILGLIVCFHALVYIEVIPYNFIWGGKITSLEQMKKYEAISFFFNLVLLLTVLFGNQIIPNNLNDRGNTFILWFYFVLFTINTFANLFSQNGLEKIIFAPLTFILSLLCMRLLMKD